MTKEELVERLNEDHLASGAPRVTKRMLSDWIDERLLPKAEPRGQKRGVSPVWHVPESALQMARKILQLKAGGITRYTALRFHLWLEYGEMDPDSLRCDLNDEFRRFMKRARRKNGTVRSFGRGAASALQPVVQSDSYRRFRHSTASMLGPELNDERLAQMHVSIQHGGLSDEGRNTKCLALQSLSRLKPDLIPELDGQNLPEIPLSLNGIIGEVDEIDDSAMSVIDDCKWETICSARDQFLSVRDFLLHSQYAVEFRDHPAPLGVPESYDEVAGMLLRHEGILLLFVAGLVWLHRGNRKGN